MGHNLYFKNVDTSIFNREDKSKIYSKDNVKIKAGSINFINVLAENNEFILPVTNLGKKQINIKEGQKVGETLYMINEKLQQSEKSLNKIELSEIRTDPDIAPV